MFFMVSCMDVLLRDVAYSRCNPHRKNQKMTQPFSRTKRASKKKGVKESFLLKEGPAFVR